MANDPKNPKGANAPESAYGEDKRSADLAKGEGEFDLITLEEREQALQAVVAAQEKLNAALKETQELEAKIGSGELSEARSAELQKQVDLMGEENKLLEQALENEINLAENAKFSRDIIESHLDYARQRLAVSEDLNQSQEDQEAAAKRIFELEKEIIKAKVQGNVVLFKQLQGEHKRLTAQKNYSKASLDELRQAELREAKQKRFNMALENTQKILSSAAGIMSRLMGVEVPSSFGDLAGMFVEAARSYDEANVSLLKTTGGAVDLGGALSRAVSESAQLGGNFETASAAVSGVYNEFTLFQQATEQEQEAIAALAVNFEKLGVEAAVTGQALEILTRGMGMSKSAAFDATLELDKLAQGLKLPTEQVAADFVALGPKMAKFGKDGAKEFENLAKKARSLGLATQEAFDLSEQFSTFEGAANLAGQLNAQLGLQLNSVELLRAKDSERIEMLRDEFLRMGKSWKDLGRFEKRAVADMLGGDELFASKMLGPKEAMIAFNEEQKEAAERAKELTTAMDSFKGAMMEMWMSIQPQMDSFLNWLKQGDAWAKIRFWMGAAGAALSASIVGFVYTAVKIKRAFLEISTTINVMSGNMNTLTVQANKFAQMMGMAAMNAEKAAVATAGGGGRGAAVMGGVMRTDKKLRGVGMGGGMGLMMAGYGLSSLSSGMDEGAGKTMVGGAGTVLGDAAMGAMLGSAIPGIGTAIGAGIGGLVGLYRAYSAAQDADRERKRTLSLSKGGMNQPMNDFIAIDGKIREFRKDDIVAGGTNLMGAAGMTNGNQPAMAIDYDKLGAAVAKAIRNSQSQSGTKESQAPIKLMVKETELGETVIKYINKKYDIVLGKQ